MNINPNKRCIQTHRIRSRSSETHDRTRPIADTSYPRQGKPTAVRERVVLSRQEAPAGAGSSEIGEHESATFLF